MGQDPPDSPLFSAAASEGGLVPVLPLIQKGGMFFCFSKIKVFEGFCEPCKGDVFLRLNIFIC